MSQEEIVQEPVSTDKSLVVKFRKLNIPLIDNASDLAISSEQDFESANKIAHAYSKDYLQNQPLTIETFKKVGFQIGEEFQFTDQGGGIDTLAGQLRNNSAENRDCKLPTFILGLIWKEMVRHDASTEIVFLKSNIAHPYVRLGINGETYFGHFAKPNPESKNQKSGFELLDHETTEELENFIRRERTTSFPLTADGMKALDLMFATEV